MKRALEIEPYLNPKLLGAVQVPDGVFDPYRFCLSFLATAKKNGATVLPYHEVTGLLLSGNAVSGVKVRDHRTGKEYEIGADLVVNATGPWAGKIAALANIDVPVLPTAGVMVVGLEALESNGGQSLEQAARRRHRGAAAHDLDHWHVVVEG